MKLASLDRNSLEQLEQQLSEQYQQHCQAGLNLDLTRGKPASDQLDLSDDLDGILQGNYITANGIDVRNYGGLDGIPEAKTLGATMLNGQADDILVGGNSSLTLMHAFMQQALNHGLTAQRRPWRNNPDDVVKVLCPVPGYDRHFTICEALNIEMVNIEMDANGPDMDAVEHWVKTDPQVKAIWCVPRFSNPTGCVYSEATVQRMAALGKIASSNFHVFWDNAYAVHSLQDNAPNLANLLELSRQQACDETPVMFASTSKVTFAGAGIAFASAANAVLEGFKQQLGTMSIGPDKTNQLRHCRFFPNAGALSKHMRKHSDLIRPKFELVVTELQKSLSEWQDISWLSPMGGYFISFDAPNNCAQDIIDLSAKAGVKLTPAGATFPYGKDPKDSNIRLAPTFAQIADIEKAMPVFVTCVKLAATRQQLNILGCNN